MDIIDLATNLTVWVVGGALIYLILWILESMHRHRERTQIYSQYCPGIPRWYVIVCGITWPWHVVTGLSDIVESVYLWIEDRVRWFLDPI